MRLLKSLCAAAVLPAFLLGPAISAAQDGSASAPSAGLPLWELGVGLAGLRIPHYRGSEESYATVLPVPYVVYRGDILRADRDGVRALLLDAERFKIDISLSASPPLDSDDSDARRGMPNLKPTVELGPNFNYTLARTPGWKLDVRMPVRAVFTVERDPQSAGFVSTPNLNLDVREGAWNLGLQAGPVFASRRQHAYFHDVAPEFATPQRPAYRAGGGASGFQALAALSRRSPGQFIGGFVRLDTIRGANFEDGPLVRRRQTLSVGFAVSWTLLRSERLVASTAP